MTRGGAFCGARCVGVAGFETYGLVVPNDARYRAALHPERLGRGPKTLSFNFFRPKKAAGLVVQRLSSRKLFIVGVAGFEPTTSSTPCWRDTRLRYTPRELEAQW